MDYSDEVRLFPLECVSTGSSPRCTLFVIMMRQIALNVSDEVSLTMMNSMGMGTGSLCLYISFSSLTTNTPNMITMDITRSQMLVDVIWTKISSRV